MFNRDGISMLQSLEVRSISDLWYNLLYHVTVPGKYTYIQEIQQGSFEREQVRYQYPFVAATITHPHLEMVPTMPVGMENLAPTSAEVINDYFVDYLMNPKLGENEVYKYAGRIHSPMPNGGTQLERVIDLLKKTPLTNQAIIEIGSPTDFDTCIGNDGKCDIPCLRLIDFKVIPQKESEELILDATAYFRSWDLWGGLPTNLGGLELLKQFVAFEANLTNGVMNVVSPGLHIYGHHRDVVNLRLGREREARDSVE